MSDDTPMTVAQALDLAIAHHEAGRLDLAESIYRQLVEQVPHHPTVLNLLGRLTFERGDVAAGERLIRQSLRIDQRNPDFWDNYAMLLLSVGRYDEGLQAVNEALAIAPAAAQSQIYLAVALFGLGRYRDAVTAGQEAVRRSPRSSDAYANLASALRKAERFDEAVEAARMAIVHRPDLPLSYRHLSKCLKDAGRPAEAVAPMEQALAMAPDVAGMRWESAQLHLLLGDLRRGFADYEWRMKWPEYHKYTPRWTTAIPMWDGGDLAGRTLLLHAEQGLGDTLQMIRYAAALRACGAGRVIVCCQSELVRLLANATDVDGVFSRGEPLPAFDVHLPMMSLPHVLGTTIETIPAALPYLHPDGEAVGRWNERFAAECGDVRLRVALCWAGRPEHWNDAARSTSLEILSPLAGVAGVRFYSIQKGVAALQAAAPPVGMDLIDCSAGLNDLADTAALVSAVDLTITVDSAPAHLAGALGRPVWVLLPQRPDWRWMLGRADSPWYPHVMRLFRQTQAGEWSETVGSVRDNLLTLTNGSGPLPCMSTGED